MWWWIGLALFAAFALHVLVLQLGTPVLGGKRPHLLRTIISVVVASVAVLCVSAAVAIPFGCLGGALGGGVSMVLGLAVGLGVRSVVYDFLLGLGLGRALALSVVAMGASWVLGAVGLGCAWAFALS